jgi:hypothetical protein
MSRETFATVFIGHAYAPQCKSYSLPVFRKMMRSIERELNSATEAANGPRVVFITELDCDSPLIRLALLRVLEQARFAVVDISDNNPNVLFELGHLAARGVPVKILKSRSSLSAGYKIPIYVDSDDVEFYAHSSDVRNVVTRWLRGQILRPTHAGPAGALLEHAL